MFVQRLRKMCLLLKQFLPNFAERKKKRLSKEKLEPPILETNCFVCGQTISGDEEELTRHVDQCLAKSQNLSHESESPSLPALQTQMKDTEDNLGSLYEEQYEVYTWGNETRIRASSLLEGGYSG